MAIPSEERAEAWAVYEPSDDMPWNVRRVVHLHRRAGFGASWQESQRDLADGPSAAVDRLIDGLTRPAADREEFASTSQMLATAAVASGDPARLKAWWVHRMLFSPDPLGERLTLMWHNHFATSNQKVDNVALMYAQNELFREHARAPFGELLPRVCKHPSMLIWLDAQANRKEHPNENLAREIMELFTLGVGNYTEADVKEAARALTGWTAAKGAFRFERELHDAGDKSILDRTGRLSGDDLLSILLEQEATAKRLAWRICDLLMGEGVVGESQLNELANGLLKRNLDINWAVETVLRSRTFYADENIGNRVLGPVEFVVGAVRALERLDPPPSTVTLAEWTARLGQDLFYPPNVFGWSGGRSWLSSRALIGRAKFAGGLVNGLLQTHRRPFDSLDLAGRYGVPMERMRLLEFYCRLLFGTDAGAAKDVLGGIEQQLQAAPDPHSGNQLVSRLLSSPLGQLG